MIDDFLNWLQVFTQRGVLTELAALAVCVALAWLVVKALHRSVENPAATSIWFGRRVVDGVLFPLLLGHRVGMPDDVFVMLGHYLPPSRSRASAPSGSCR